LAKLARAAHEAAFDGNKVIQEQIKYGAGVLAKSVESAARRLKFSGAFPVSSVGGMFRGALMKKYFTEVLNETVPAAIFTEPRFNPAIGALLLAYKQAEIEINENLLANLEKSEAQ
jgi:hypothetical protein